MGVSLRTLIEGSEYSLEQLQGSVIAVDAMNMIYQFVTTIRQHDGTPLKDSNGKVTSHLTGLFSRVTRLLRYGVSLVFVFDGTMPDLKSKERERRDALKQRALTSLKEAESVKDVEAMKKYASRTSKVTAEMVEESKELLQALGIPCITAPSEGEAQAAHMVGRGDCDYVASQDFDCLMYGAPRVVRNLSIGQRRKKINTLTYKSIKPEVIELEEVLRSLGITLDQLRVLSILVGTDFNYGGVKGIGPKKGLALVKEHGDDFQKIFDAVEWDTHWEIPWKEVFSAIRDMPTTSEYELSWNDIDRKKLVELLVTEHDFSEERITSTIDDVEKVKHQARQTNLDTFFT
ncbi:MAG: flap endonuclease-1 [Candidatus Woesearchaeota archaeon]